MPKWPTAAPTHHNRGRATPSKSLNRLDNRYFLEPVIQPKVLVQPHPWAQCCPPAALDAINLHDIWGFDHRIGLVQWAHRFYPGEGVTTAIDQAWTRLKRRLRAHGLIVQAPDTSQGAESRKFAHGELTWLSLPSTPHNRKALQRLISKVDDDLLRRGEDYWSDLAVKRAKRGH